MDETEIKTRQGLILEGVLAAALTKAGYKFDQDAQYDEGCEKPDFLIPDAKHPRFMFEVHQTEARDSFRMKILRAFTAVTESKAHFGNNLVSVNILFGNPDDELPPSNVKAMCGIFDVSIIPRRESAKAALIKKMEAYALTLAGKENKKTEIAAKEVVKAHPVAVVELGNLIKTRIAKAQARAELDELWELERKRAKSFGKPPKAGDPTYYKRCMLWALFLKDEDFVELHKKQDPDKCSASVKRQLLATKLATVCEEIDGDRYVLRAEFAGFLKDTECLHLRSMCKDVLDTVPAMKWFFEDVRDERRRSSMCRLVCELLQGDQQRFYDVFVDSFLNGELAGHDHSRAWVCDLAPLAIGKSHNFFNGLLYRSENYSLTLANPYPNIVIRSSRLSPSNMNVVSSVREAARLIWETYQREGQLLSPIELERAFLDFRINNAIKLKKLDPFLLLIGQILNSLALSIEVSATCNVIADLAEDSSVARFRIHQIEEASSGSRALFNAVAVHDNHGDDKSKEWGGRRLATLYRMEKNKIFKSEYQEGIFVLDGEWKDKDVARLYRSGWNHVVRLADLESTLRSVFGINKSSVVTSAKLSIPVSGLEDEEDLAMAAEDAKPLKLKRKRGRG